MKKTVFVINGPNLNLLGKREPHLYGLQTLTNVEDLCQKQADAHGFGLIFRQSNHEGDLVEYLHEAGELHQQGRLAGVILNAGAYTHTSIALHDAIKGTQVEIIELHISNIFSREQFRHQSYISSVAKAVMCGFGVYGYALAIKAIANWHA